MKQTSLNATIAFAVLIVSAVTASAGSITLNPDKDNTIVQATDPAGQLSNALGDIFVGRTNQDGSGPAVTSIRRGLVHFNVAGSLPAGAVVTGVTLSMHDVMGNNGNQTLSLERVLQDWGQGTSSSSGNSAPATNGDATWLYAFYNSTNPSMSPPWTSAGGSFNNVASASAVDLGGAGGGTVIWTSAQLIADVQSWRNDPADNFGWGILGNESTGMTAKRLNSSESASPPALTITYTAPEPAAAAMALVGMVTALAWGWSRRDKS